MKFQSPFGLQSLQFQILLPKISPRERLRPFYPVTPCHTSAGSTFALRPACAAADRGATSTTKAPSSVSCGSEAPGGLVCRVPPEGKKKEKKKRTSCGTSYAQSQRVWAKAISTHQAHRPGHARLAGRRSARAASGRPERKAPGCGSAPRPGGSSAPQSLESRSLQLKGCAAWVDKLEETVENSLDKKYSVHFES